MVFNPDDFAGRPYEGGLNQMGHHLFGAALLGFASFVLPLGLFWCVLISGAGYVTWEGIQLKRAGATIQDYAFDLLYWLSGTALWAFAIHAQVVLEWGKLLPIAGLLIWLVEFKRLSVKDGSD